MRGGARSKKGTGGEPRKKERDILEKKLKGNETKVVNITAGTLRAGGGRVSLWGDDGEGGV